MSKTEIVNTVIGRRVIIGSVQIDLTDEQFKDLMRSAIETMNAEVSNDWRTFVGLDCKAGA